MKIKSFILMALMQGIMGLSYAQSNDPYPPINRSTSFANGEKISLTRAYIDSIANVPAADPEKDSAVASADSTKDSVQVAVTPPTIAVAETHADQGEDRIIFGFLIKNLAWIITSLLVLAAIVIAVVVNWPRKKAAGATGRPDKTQIFADNMKKKISAGEELLTKICTGKVDLNNDKKVSNFKKLMIFIRDLDKPWLRVMRYSGLFILGCGLIFVLFVFARTPNVRIYNSEVVQAAPTQTFVSVAPSVEDEYEEPAYEEPTSYRDDQTVATTPSNEPMLVYVPSQGESKPVYIKLGDVNQLSEKSAYYEVTHKQGYAFRAVPLSPVRTVLPNNTFFDQNPNDAINSIGSGLTGKRVYASLTGQATHVRFTIEPL